MVVSERSQPSGNFPSTIPAKKAPCKLKESISLSSEAIKGRQKFCRPRANERRSSNWSYGISLNSNRNLLVVQGCRGEEILVSGGLLCIISIKEVMALWFKTQDHVNTATQQQRTTTQQHGSQPF